MEADVFEKEQASVGEFFAFFFGVRANAILGEVHGPLEKFLELGGDRGERILWIRTALGPAKMRCEDEASAFLDGEAQGRERLANARVVGNRAILQRDIEVDANEHA